MNFRSLRNKVSQQLYRPTTKSDGPAFTKDLKKTLEEMDKSLDKNINLITGKKAKSAKGAKSAKKDDKADKKDDKTEKKEDKEKT